MPRVPFTEAQISRALRAAGRMDPPWTVRVNKEGLIEICAPDGKADTTEVDKWFAEHGEG